MKKRTNKNRKSPAEWAEAAKPQEYSTESPPWQQVMDRLEGRMLCYGNLAARCRGGPKQYTKSQMEEAKAKAMQEARIIVWMHSDDEKLDKVVCRSTGEELTRVWDALSESQREAAGTTDEKPDGQAENAPP